MYLFKFESVSFLESQTNYLIIFRIHLVDQQ